MNESKNSSKEIQLEDFPLLTKGIIRENFQSIKSSQEFQKNIIQEYTLKGKICVILVRIK